MSILSRGLKWEYNLCQLSLHSADFVPELQEASKMYANFKNMWDKGEAKARHTAWKSVIVVEINVVPC